jgi:hypothetical protein
MIAHQSTDSTTPISRPGRWTRWLVLALTAVLLPAVPVSALTFLSQWTAVQTKRDHGAPAANIVKDFAGTGTLLVDMGRTTAPKARSRVEASRDFEITANGGETISITNAFQTLLRDAALQVTIKIIPAKGFKAQKIKFDIPRNREEVVGVNETALAQLAAGEYRMEIVIDYKNRNGTWDNTFPAPGSPHTFAIRSL